MRTIPAPPPALSVGVVLVPDFTMLAFAALVDTLRLAADDADRSRPNRCRWHLMSVDGRPVRSSSGAEVGPCRRLGDVAALDYVAVVGGTLHREHDLGDLHAWLRDAGRAGTPLAGLCNGAVHLARAGLLDGRRMCVSWLHRDELAAEFPKVRVVADELYVWEGDRITCAGGTGVIHLASAMVDRHLGPGASRKGLRIMLEERRRDGSAPQPPPDLVPDPDAVRDPRVRRVLLAIEGRLAEGPRVAELAAAAGVSARQLDRLVRAETGRSVGSLVREMRLGSARRLVEEGGEATLAAVAARCGFADAAHLSRSFRARFGVPPSALRREGLWTPNR